MAKPTILHLGDDIQFNTKLYASLQASFTIVRPTLAERQRDAFLDALRSRKWGDFAGVMKPYWSSGGEMGRWDRELVPLLPASMRVYAAAGAGFDWADGDLFAARGILYCNGAAASSEAVADMALYHILSVFRNLQWTNMAARSLVPADFLDAHHNSPRTARNPRGHTLGIVGFGNIGSCIAAKAHAALGMRIIYYDPSPKAAAKAAALLEAPVGTVGAVPAIRKDTLEALLAQADCVVLAAPGSSGRILDAARIALMPRGSRIVNIARGVLVDTDAVADALASGHIQAVGLDVHEDEPNVNPRLAADRRATLTCHSAGGALETTIGFERLAMENVRNVLTGQPALTPVNEHLMSKGSL